MVGCSLNVVHRMLIVQHDQYCVCHWPEFINLDRPKRELSPIAISYRYTTLTPCGHDYTLLRLPHIRPSLGKQHSNAVLALLSVSVVILSMIKNGQQI